MSELIGFKNINWLNDINLIKRELLLFDKIFVVGYKEWKEVFESDNINNHNDLIAQKGLLHLNDFVMYQGNISLKIEINKLGGLEKYYEQTKNELTEFRNQNLKYLADEGKLISDYDILNRGKEYHESYSKVRPIIETEIQKGLKNKESDFLQLCVMCHDLKTRVLTSSSSLDNCTLIPCDSSFYEVKQLTTIKANVYNLILEDFPIIEVEGLSWEQIFDFKKDPDSYNSIWGLRNWINTVSKSGKTINEIEEEYRELKFKYEQAIKIHNLRTSNSVFQTTIQTGAELLENIARLKFSKIADLMFKFKENQISLMETELKSDGNQLSYLFKVKNAFK